MDALRVKYEQQTKEYEALVDQGDASKVPKLRELNASIAKTLNEMIEQVTFLKKDTPSLKKERDELIERLRQIQKDYNGLLVNTDSLETLRRIRQQESTEANRQLYIYVGLFLAACLLIALFLMFFPQRNDMTAASASMPPTAAAFV